MASPDDDDNLIMLSALQHYSYCPRQYALIHLEQEFADNVHTNRGHAVHKKVDEPGSSDIKGIRVERALPLYSHRLGLVGKADTVEFHKDNIPYPVEYKHGAKRIKLHDDIQLAAQALCLEEMTGKNVTHGAIYHHLSRSRRVVEITKELRTYVENTVAAIRKIMISGMLPPAIYDARCNQCSLINICQPEAVSTPKRLMTCWQNLFDTSEKIS